MSFAISSRRLPIQRVRLAMLLGILSIPESTANKGFGDPMRYWTATRILSYLVEDNKAMEVQAVETPLGWTLQYDECTEYHLLIETSRRCNG